MKETTHEISVRYITLPMADRYSSAKYDGRGFFVVTVEEDASDIQSVAVCNGCVYMVAQGNMFENYPKVNREPEVLKNEKPAAVDADLLLRAMAVAQKPELAFERHE